MRDSYTCNPEIMNFAGSFGAEIKKGQVKPHDGNLQVEWEIDEMLRSEMLRKVGERVCSLVKEENVPPSEIAIVAPFVDPVMECTLAEHLSREGIPAVNIARRRRAKDNPFVNALITLACLAHPQFEILPSFTDIANTVSLVLGMDPIRSSLVADAITHERPYMFPRIEDVRQRERIGFSNAERYEYIRDWLLEYMRGKALPIEEFFRKVFLEILISLPKAQENMMACQQVIDSASSFLKGLALFTEIQDPNREFVMAVLKGSKAAESLVDVEKALEIEGVLLTTPIHYLYTSKNSSIQIWCDIRSSSWIPRDIKELSNPYVLSRSWSPKQEFSPEWEEAAMLEKLAVLVQCLLKRCKERVILASSQYNSQGYEDDGILSAFWEEALQKSKGRES